jgi:hypothetical protein
LEILSRQKIASEKNLRSPPDGKIPSEKKNGALPTKKFFRKKSLENLPMKRRIAFAYQDAVLIDGINQKRD